MWFILLTINVFSIFYEYLFLSYNKGVPVPYYNSWWRWILINLIVYIPYIFFGIVIETILLVLLGAIGIFEDTWRFSNLVAYQINDTSFQIVLQVVLFAAIGLFIGIFGLKVNQFQYDVQVRVRVWIARHFGFMISSRSGIDEQDTNASTGGNDVNAAVSIL